MKERTNSPEEAWNSEYRRHLKIRKKLKWITEQSQGSTQTNKYKCKPKFISKSQACMTVCVWEFLAKSKQGVSDILLWCSLRESDGNPYHLPVKYVWGKKKKQACQIYVLQTVIKGVSSVLVWLFGLERSLESTIQIFMCLDLPWNWLSSCDTEKLGQCKD